MPTALRKVAENLGGITLLGRDISNELDLVDLIEGGLPFETTERIVQAKVVTADEFKNLVVAPTTLSRRRKEGKLDAGESDRLVRLTRVVELARDALGPEKGDKWMRRPNRALKGKIPLELCRSEAGARLVEAVLDRINYGGIS